MKKTIYILLTFWTTLLYTSESFDFMQQIYNDNKKSCDEIYTYKGEKLTRAAEACAVLAIGYIEGNDIKQNYNKAFKYFSTACKYNNSYACYKLSRMYQKGQGIKKNYVEAKRYLQIACDKNFATACQDMEYLMSNPLIMETLNKLTSNTISITTNKCKNNNYQGCLDIGNFYYEGQDIPQDYIKAAEYYTKACNLGSPGGCYQLAEVYYHGKIEKKDIVKSNKYYKKSCNLGYSQACNVIGLNYSSGWNGFYKDFYKAFEYFNKACSRGYNIGCRNLGRAYEKGRGVRQSDNEALKFYGKSCDDGYHVGCDDYAKLNKQLSSIGMRP